MVKSKLSLFIIIFLASVFSVELVARSLIDIKLYERDVEVGYWSKPNQSGGALLTKPYVFNAQGFGTEDTYLPDGERDVLLLGDSIVAGNFENNQEARLGIVLEHKTDWEVWPMATGSWSLANELRVTKRISLDGIEAIIFVINSEDLHEPSYWKSDYHLPRTEPTFYIIYALQKLFRILRPESTPLRVRKGNLENEWTEFRAGTSIPVFVFGYDWAKTTGQKCKWLPNWIDAETFCYDPIAMGFEEHMTDAIHLSDKGNEIFANFIADKLERSPEWKINEATRLRHN